MSESDGRLAPVTYLFGGQPPSADTSAPVAPSARADRVVPPVGHADSDDDERDDEEGDGWDEGDSSCAELTDAYARAETDPELKARLHAETAALGRMWQEERAEAERRLTESDRVQKVSMHALTRRGMSRREMERTLRSREFDDIEIENEVHRLESVGLLDDMALAQNLVGTLQERKGLGRSGVAAELTRRLLLPAAIEYALELVDSGDELARAREIAIKRAGQLRSLDHDVAVRRLTGFLMRRGYSGSTLRSAVDAALPKSASAGSSVRFR